MYKRLTNRVPGHNLTSCRPYSITTCSEGNIIIYRDKKRILQKHMLNSTVATVLADGLGPISAKAFAENVMTTFPVHTGSENKGTIL